MTAPSPTMLAGKRVTKPKEPVKPPTELVTNPPTRNDVYQYVKSKYVPTLDEETHRWIFTNSGYRVSWTEVLADLMSRYPTMYSRADQPYAYVIGRLYTEHEKTT